MASALDDRIESVRAELAAAEKALEGYEITTPAAAVEGTLARRDALAWMLAKHERDEAAKFQARAEEERARVERAEREVEQKKEVQAQRLEQLRREGAERVARMLTDAGFPPAKDGGDAGDKG